MGRAGARLGLGSHAARRGSGLDHRAAAAVRYVVWHGVLLAVGGPERTRRETRRPALGEPATGCDTAYVLQYANPRRKVLREHPVRLRGGVARARTQAQRRASGTACG